MPRRRHQLATMLCMARGRWQTSPVTGESAKETVKTIARGMPGVSGVTVVTNARVYYTPRAAAGAPGARHSLRPLSLGRNLLTKLARMRGEIAVACEMGCLKIELHLGTPPRVVPANAGTHTPRLGVLARCRTPCAQFELRCLWVLAYAGTTLSFGHLLR